jgi:WD40 repeat protein
VALKVIKLGMDTAEVIARFEAERQALTLMNHPNIAKILDAGMTTSGRPFFVMELVLGVKITDYCDENQLLARERLELFIQVCRAIQHAHQKGIIHRDIKPSNILVALQDGAPVPQVIDFGIAKATQGRLTDNTLFTAFEQFIGTPAYMSPEQAELSTLDIDTRSDIYSLGVLLYELLTGKTPFDTKQLLASGLDELRRTIREREPLPPSIRLRRLNPPDLSETAQSRRQEPSKLIHLLQGDLDWIVMKALEKDRTRRYETANGLALDVERHLSNEPVSARSPTKFYRFQKLVRRNQMAFGAAVTLGLVLVAGAIVSSWQALRAGRAERQAEHAASVASLAQEAAEKQRGLAQERGDRLRLLSYAHEMNLALRYCQEANFGAAWDLLQHYTSKPGETDLRGFEWRYLYRRCRGNFSRALPRHNQVLGRMEYSPDGRLLATYCWDRKLRLWDLRQSATVPVFEIGSSSGLGTFSSDGGALVFGGSNGTVKVFEIEKHQLSDALVDAGEMVDFAPRSSRAVTFAAGKGLRVWDLADKRLKLLLPQFARRFLDEGWVRPAIIDADGKTHAVVESDEPTETRERNLGIRLWDVEGGSDRGLLEDDRQIRALRFSPSGRYLAAAHGDGTVLIWNLVNNESQLVVVQEKPVTALAFSADESELATGGSDGTIKRWDSADGTEKESKLRGHAGMVGALAYSAREAELASGGRDTSVKIWKLDQPDAGDEIQDLHTKEFGNVAFSADGKSVAAGCNDITVKVWELETLKLTMVLTGMQYVVAFTRDSKHLLASTPGNAGYWWDLEHQTAHSLAAYKGNIKRVTCVDLSPDERVAALGLADGAIQFLEVESGKEVGHLLGHSGQVKSLKFSSDGNTLVSGGNDRFFKIWDVRHLALLGGKEEHKAAVCAVAISHDGQWLASGCGVGTLKLWDPRDLSNSLVTIASHKSIIRALDFSQDRKTLASGSEDKTMKLWSLASLVTAQSQREVASFLYRANVRWVQFSPDDRVLGVVTEDGVLHLLRAIGLQEADEEIRLLNP